MGVVHDGRRAVGRADLLEAAAHGVQHAQDAQHLAPVEPQQDRRAVDRQQVIGVEPPQQPHPQLLPVDAQQHAVEVHLDDLAAEIDHRTQRVGAHRGRRVLHHHAAVAVVGIRQHESPFGQAVEEEFLGPDVFGEGLVIVEVVVGDVGEDAAGEVEPPRALLHDGVRRTLHEAEFAPGVGHLAHHGVQTDRVGGRVGRLDLAAVDLVDHRRDQPGLVAQGPHEVVQQRHGRGLAVGSGDAHQFQFAARIAVKRRRHVGHRPRRVFDHDIRDALGRRLGHPLADHRRGALRNSRRDVVVAVALRPRHGEEAVARLHRPRIVGQSGDRRRAVAVQRPDRRIFQQFRKFLHFISMLYSPPSPARCGFRRRCFAVSRPPAP